MHQGLCFKNTNVQSTTLKSCAVHDATVEYGVLLIKVGFVVCVYMAFTRLEWQTAYPRVPRPDMGGLGGF